MNIPRAKIKEVFYVIAPDFTIKSFIELNDNLDNRQYSIYNYFTSKVEAEKYAKILQETLVKLRKEEAMKKENK